MSLTLTVEEAQARILAALHRCSSETVSIERALGRVTSANLCARRSLPGFTNSAMDGYAVRAQSLAQASYERPVTLAIGEHVPAGTAPLASVAEGLAARIYTGAPVPSGANAVVMQEDVLVSGPHILVRAPVREGANIRYVGEDVLVGALCIAAGTTLRAGDIGMCAAQGACFVEVVRQPIVAIVPTGNEVVEIDAVLASGQVANSNSHMLAAQVLEAGGIARRYQPAADTLEALTKTLKDAAENADLVLTSGGVSVGDFDLVRKTLELDFWRVALKPGAPLAFGAFLGTPLLGLPGNPVSSFVCFELFARPAVRRLCGAEVLFRPSLRARAQAPITPNRKRREFVRGRVAAVDGALAFCAKPRQGSHDLSSLVGINALLDVPAGESVLPKGTELCCLCLD